MLARVEYIVHGERIPLVVLRILQERRAERDLLDEELAVLGNVERDEGATGVERRDTSY